MANETGEVLWFDFGKGFGYLKTISGQDLFFHENDIPADFLPNQGGKVFFERGTNRKGECAVSVREAVSPVDAKTTKSKSESTSVEDFDRLTPSGAFRISPLPAKLDEAIPIELGEANIMILGGAVERFEVLVVASEDTFQSLAALDDVSESFLAAYQGPNDSGGYQIMGYDKAFKQWRPMIAPDGGQLHEVRLAD